MGAELLWWLIGGLVAVLLLQFLHLVGVLAWSQQRTRGTAYYGRPPAERSKFKTQLRRHARVLHPMLALLARMSRFSFAAASVRRDELTVPKGSCTEASLAAALAYEPRAEDVFVVTQMKCGTTWMQHLVYEILERGSGRIVDSGTTMYALSPWLEAVTAVGVEDAPLVGEPPSRIIKTHLPADVCPYSAYARYIYVARHPVSCFMSCVDFIATNMGRAAPSADVVREWFCSPAMWWGPWTAHVAGWWRRAQTDPNVLFVRFEDMKADLRGVAESVARFLHVELTAEQLENVVRKSGFDYMRRHRDAFEMNPPHLLQADAELFVSGSAERYRDAPPELRSAIIEWCAQESASRGHHLELIYPDIGAPTHTRTGEKARATFR